METIFTQETEFSLKIHKGNSNTTLNLKITIVCTFIEKITSMLMATSKIRQEKINFYISYCLNKTNYKDQNHEKFEILFFNITLKTMRCNTAFEM